MIYIKCYKVIENGCVMHSMRILEKYKNSDVLPFDKYDPIDCYKYLKNKYGHLRAKEKIPLAFLIHNFGGIKGVKNSEKRDKIFPPYDKFGNKLPVGVYGRLDVFPIEYPKIMQMQTEELSLKEQREKEKEDYNYEEKNGKL